MATPQYRMLLFLPTRTLLDAGGKEDLKFLYLPQSTL
jgi:hypothetical protein